MKYQSARRQRDRIKALDRTIPSVIPKLPWYAGAGDHFGEVRSKYYANQFFSNLKG